MNKNILLPCLMYFLALLFACSPSSEYHQLVERELATGIRHDSLFLGIYLGMSSKDFYGHCWELHKQGIIKEGASNTSVFYAIKDFKEAASMDFYPAFVEDKIASMPVLISYDKWAPWNKALFSDKLIIEVKDLLDKWYGPSYLEIENPGKFGVQSNAYIKVHGNRRISVYAVDDSQVRIDFVDLLVMQDEKNADR